MVANAAFPKAPLGSPKFGWFVALNIFPRNCSFVFSVMRKDFAILAFSAFEHAPSMRYRPADPNVEGAGATKAFLSSHRSTVRAPASKFAGPTRSGGAVPVEALLVSPVVTVSEPALRSDRRAPAVHHACP